ncbi:MULTISPECIES: DUF4870 domain-containing protein [unclassified Rathayibacter]|uniref:DUF4870 domain-containing protein n=1 Tax=unclassified Rathayibacter TaxID=2609250 RepID=UPI00188B0942|nr:MULTISPECIES: DUF4870 domain-containing protein [unclassified Rathayibacter]MBF4462921.1 DUF4870 domain-containing protein [Rathayibacter sp. VKM Ac-2879]MBF4504335.1 DUF4870 domain-containing protein [Rathayibacter sp. VKM Ac-2878]
MDTPAVDPRPVDASEQEAPPAAPAGPTGALSYALGFLTFAIPFFGLIIAGIVMAAVYPSARRKGGLAAENARYAANWGLTVASVGVVLVAAHVVLLLLASGTPLARGFSPVGIPMTIFAVLWVVHLVLIIVGLVRTNQRVVFRPRIAIPFFRA